MPDVVFPSRPYAMKRTDKLEAGAVQLYNSCAFSESD